MSKRNYVEPVCGKDEELIAMERMVFILRDFSFKEKARILGYVVSRSGLTTPNHYSTLR